MWSSPLTWGNRGASSRRPSANSQPGKLIKPDNLFKRYTEHTSATSHPLRRTSYLIRSNTLCLFPRLIVKMYLNYWFPRKVAMVRDVWELVGGLCCEVTKIATLSTEAKQSLLVEAGDQLAMLCPPYAWVLWSLCHNMPCLSVVCNPKPSPLTRSCSHLYPFPRYIAFKRDSSFWHCLLALYKAVHMKMSHS